MEIFVRRSTAVLTLPLMLKRKLPLRSLQAQGLLYFVQIVLLPFQLQLQECLPIHGHILMVLAQ